MNCPLCNQEIKDVNDIFAVKNVFALSGKLDAYSSVNNNVCGGGGDNNITLTACNFCGYIFNRDFNFESVSKEYQSSTFFSRKIVSDSMGANIQLIRDKILKIVPKESNCIEIAPGSGDMVTALAPYVNFIYTVDPSLVSLEIEGIHNLKHIQGFFDYTILKNNINGAINFVMFRHLLEHIHTPRIFLEDVIKILQESGIIYVEVPNIDEFIENNRFYEIFNDHCGYYQYSTLINIFQDLGCTHIDTIYLYENQHMGLFFKKEHSPKKSLSFKLYKLDALKQNIQKINSLLQKYHSIAIYGAGAHGNTITNYLNCGILENIKKCFDLDARKHGKFLQNSNIIICNPNKDTLKDIEAIVIASPLYEKEVVRFLRNNNFKGDIITTQRNIDILKS